MELTLRRGIAFLFDCALLFIVLWPAGLLLQKLTGVRPESSIEVWYTLLLNFSLPVWLYFIVSDASRGGASIGKRRQHLSVGDVVTGDRIGVGRAIVRTAAKLLPWELIHVSAFALSPDTNEFGVRQTVGITIGNGLFIGYAVAVLVTQGRRSVHDFVARTAVRRHSS
jgi:uncharacterized RDD family membrane protein YckC